MPEQATESEIAELQLKLAEVKKKVQIQAKQAGRGPLVTEKLIEAAQIRARNEAHDRVHQRLLDEQLNPPVMEEMVPIQAVVPAKVLDAMLSKEGRDRA